MTRAELFRKISAALNANVAGTMQADEVCDIMTENLIALKNAEVHLSCMQSLMDFRAFDDKVPPMRWMLDRLKYLAHHIERGDIVCLPPVFFDQLLEVVPLVLSDADVR
jgi:hypothetical protein